MCKQLAVISEGGGGCPDVYLLGFSRSVTSLRNPHWVFLIICAAVSG